MSPPVLVILNPRAGAARRLDREVARALEARGVSFRLQRTEAPGHATGLAEEAARAGLRAVVAVGGDGTVHEVANGLLAAAPEGAGTTALGVVPAGTGNDFAKQIEGVRGRERAYDVIAGGRVRRFDVGLATWAGGREHFVNGAGTGIDVEVVRRLTSHTKLPGALSYLAALLGALRGYRALPVRLELDATERRQRIMILAVGNGPCIGGGFWMCPAARPDDGLLDACVVAEVGTVRIARTLVRVLRGTHGVLPWVDMETARRVVIETEGGAPLYFQLDGELRHAGEGRLELDVRPGALPVLVPEARP